MIGHVITLVPQLLALGLAVGQAGQGVLKLHPPVCVPSLQTVVLALQLLQTPTQALPILGTCDNHVTVM